MTQYFSTSIIHSSHVISQLIIYKTPLISYCCYNRMSQLSKSHSIVDWHTSTNAVLLHFLLQQLHLQLCKWLTQNDYTLHHHKLAAHFQHSSVQEALSLPCTMLYQLTAHWTSSYMHCSCFNEASSLLQELLFTLYFLSEDKKRKKLQQCNAK